jgi:hypothetical protein
MVKLAFRVLVCVVSFAFTAYFTFVLFAIASRPVAEALRSSNHSEFAQVVDFLALIPGTVAGFYAARTALRLEVRRQSAR